MKTVNSIKNALQSLRLRRRLKIMLSIPVILSTVQADEPKYIGIPDLAQRFDLRESTIDGDTTSLESRKTNIRLTALKTDCVLNSVTFGLIHPVIRSEGTLMVSESDVENLMTPLLQPDRLINREPVRVLLIQVEDNDPQSKRPGNGVESKWTDLVVAALGKCMPKQPDSLTLKQLRGSSVEQVDRESSVLIRLSCEGNPEYPITVKTCAPAPSPVLREPSGATADPAGFGSIALAAAIQGAVGRRLGEHQREGRVDWAQLPEIAQLGYPAVRMEFSPPDTTKIDGKALEDYAMAVARGISDGVLRFENARTN